MLKLLFLTSTFQYFKPRLANITSVIKKKQAALAQQSSYKPKINIKIGEQGTSQQANEDILNPKEIKSIISSQRKNLSKEELTINHLIKTQTKFSALHFYYKNNYKSFSHQNIVNLIIKIVQLRLVNKRQQSQSQKFNSIIKHACKSIQNSPPEEMIRFLFMLKKIRLNIREYVGIDPFIKVILKEFDSLGLEHKIGKRQKYSQLFNLISIETSIKFIHSLYYIHQLTGKHYEPLIVDIIKNSLTFFHEIAQNPKNHSILYSKKFIEWTFYCNFFLMSKIYNQPLNIMLNFMRSINANMQLNQDKHSMIFLVEDTLHTSQQINLHCRGVNIQKYKEVYNIHSLIFSLIENGNQLIKVHPLSLLKHLNHLNGFTQDQQNALGISQMVSSTYFKVNVFIIKILQKYFIQNYQHNVEKSNIEKWINLSTTSEVQFLGSYITLLSQLHTKNKIKSQQFNKLINLCLQFYSKLSLYTKFIVLSFSIKNGYKNVKFIIDILDNKKEKESLEKSSSVFKKILEVKEYIKTFDMWQKINKISPITFNQYKQNAFLKIFFTHIIDLTNIEQIAQSFANRINIDHHFFSFLIKKYISLSQRNRTLRKGLLNSVKELSFKQQLEQQPLILNETEDNNKFSKFVSQKHELRQKIKRSLSAFRFLIILLQNLRMGANSTSVNITESTLFKELLFHFNEQIKELYYKELFTEQIYELANQICEYLQKRDVNSEDIQVFAISKIFQRDIQKNSLLKFKKICNKYEIQPKSQQI